MSDKKLASIIIDNYNYGRFLREAIDSALDQTYAPIEVIVVDDGSTDDSRQIIAEYGQRVIPILKVNGGQASAFNAGFEKSRGEAIFFLDSDDILLPTAVQKAMELFTETGISKVHWSLYVMDEQGTKKREMIPQEELPEGDFREQALRTGPPFCLSPPTSGNAWSRRFIQSVMPIPEIEFKIGADTYLFEMAPFFGPVRRIQEPQGGYRIHGLNNYCNKPFSDKLRHELRFYNSLFAMLERYCNDLGLKADPKIWKVNSWFHRLQTAIQEITKIVPEKNTIVLVDDATWGIGDLLEGRSVMPFLEAKGLYAGLPRDDVQATAELERLRHNRAAYIIFAWPSFWWLEHYAGFHRYLRDQYDCILENERLVIFDMRKAA